MNQPEVSRHNGVQLRTAQMRMLDILLAVDDICRRHGFTYWIDNGTLLGAVRHGGFIPWDDDMDIAMPMDDYNRFAAVANGELPEGLTLLAEHTGKHTVRRLPKVVDTDSFYVEANDDLSLARPRGIYIDITPFIGFPTRFAGMSRRVSRGLSVAHNILHTRHYYTLRSFVELFYFSAKYALFRGIWAVLTKVGGSGKRTAPATNVNGYGLSHSVATLFPLAQADFEGHALPVPADADKYLTEVYGDWRVIPPVEKRKIHAVYMNSKLDR